MPTRCAPTVRRLAPVIILLLITIAAILPHACNAQRAAVSIGSRLKDAVGGSGGSRGQSAAEDVGSEETESGESFLRWLERISHAPGGLVALLLCLVVGAYGVMGVATVPRGGRGRDAGQTLGKREDCECTSHPHPQTHTVSRPLSEITISKYPSSLPPFAFFGTHRKSFAERLSQMKMSSWRTTRTWTQAPSAGSRSDSRTSA